MNLNHFESIVRYKTSRLPALGDSIGGKDWLWTVLTKNNTSFSINLSFPGLNPSYTGYYYVATTNSPPVNAYGITLGGMNPGSVNMWNPITLWQDSLLNISLSDPSTRMEISHIDFRYAQNLDVQGRNTMRVYSPRSPDHTITRYTISNLPSGISHLLRIGRDESEIQQVAMLSGGGSFSWVDTAGIGIQYFISSEPAILTPQNLQFIVPAEQGPFEITDLRNSSNRCDYLIITYKDFKPEALRLAEHKKSTGTFLYPRVVELGDIYREFSGGNQDPSAIRNFLFYAHTFWTPVRSQADPGPDYAVLVGCGHYDYKNYANSEINFIPTAQYGKNSLEDYYSCISPGTFAENEAEAPDLFLGRIPCQSLSDAKNVVDKIIETEGAEADFGPWRNRLLLVSDDHKQGPKIDDVKGHYLGNETIGRDIKQKMPSVEIRKVILFEFKTNEVYAKPEASSLLIREINNGVGFVNFYGHGNANTWTDEGIFDKQKIAFLTNKKQYPLVTAFSCNVGHFDIPNMTSLAEALVTAPQAGAIVTIASSRSASSWLNQNMGTTLYRTIFDKEKAFSCGQAYCFTKASHNLKNYVLFGDPSIRLLNIHDTVSMQMFSDDDLPLHDTLKSLQPVTIRGTIAHNTTTNTSFGTEQKPAYIHLALFNPPNESVKAKYDYCDTGITYCLPGTMLFRGIFPVKNGAFENKLIIPRKVVSRIKAASLVAYAWDGSRIATGIRDSLIFYGADTFTVSNNEGPRIVVRPVYDNDSLWNTGIGFTDKVASFLPLECEIQVWDEHGIDISGTGPDEGLTYEIPGAAARQSINNRFLFNEGTITQGRASIVFDKGSINPGTYELDVRAQDLLGKVSKSNITLEIVSEEDFKLGHVFNYPNPIRMGTRTAFYFYHTNTSELYHGAVEATIKIFTLSGKLVRVFHNARNGQIWDLRDQNGHALPPNIYLYRVTARQLQSGMSGNEKKVSSATKKLVILPPR